MSVLALRRGFALGSRPALCFFLGIRPVMQFWRSTLPSKCGCPYKPVTVFCPRFAPALRFCCRVLTSVYVRAGVASRLCPRFAPGLAILLSRFDFGLCPRWRCGAALPSVRARLIVSVEVFYPRFTPAVCRIAPNRTACDILRFYSAGSRSPFVRSRGVGTVICLGRFTSGLFVYLWRSRRGYRGHEERGTGKRGWRRSLCALLRRRIGFEMLSAGSTLGATRPQTCAKESSTLWTLFRGWPSGKVYFTQRCYASTCSQPLCTFAQPHRPCNAFRGEYAGAPRPRLRQRVFDSLDSLHAAAGLP